MGSAVTVSEAVQPLHVAAWIEAQAREVSAPTVKQRLAAIRHLFDWLVDGPNRAGQSGCIRARPATRAPRNSTIADAMT
jgi:hypothetical protein